jgi:hypothetical protein
MNEVTNKLASQQADAISSVFAITPSIFEAAGVVQYVEWCA